MAKKNYSSLTVLAFLIPYLWSSNVKLRLRIIFSIFLTLTLVGVNVFIPFAFKNIVNTFAVSRPHSKPIVLAMLIGYGVVWTIGQCIARLRAIAIFRTLEHGMRALALDIFDHLLALSVRFHVERRTGALMNYVDQAQKGLDSVFWGLVSFLIPTALEIIVAIGVIAYFYGFIYAFGLFFIALLYLVFSAFNMDRVLVAQRGHNEKQARSRAYLVDVLLNVETVKYFNNEKYEHQKANRLFKEQEDAGVKRYMTNEYVQLSQMLIIGLGLTCLTFISGVSVYDGVLTIGDFVLINGYLLQFALPLNHFSYIVQEVRRGMLNMGPVLEIIDTKPEIKNSKKAEELNLSDTSVTFSNVSFGYQPERGILNNVSFMVPAGKRVAIVGPSGSGKSTIARLLFRFYDVTSGAIKIGNQDIKTVTQESLHKAIGIVPQDTVLFNETLYYNIVYGNPEASFEDVCQVVELANLTDFINSLPHGYNTIVGERGFKVSGGERQRISLARALLKKPNLFIFDEATSALDTKTEKEIQKNIEKASRGTTSIIIAHRLSTITDADKIIVLNKGKLEEQGTHQELLTMNGLYAEMYYRQMESCP